MRSVITFSMAVIVTTVWSIHSSHANSPLSATDRLFESYFFVSGGVCAPGRYNWTNGMTVLDGINVAGGFTDSAEHWIKIVHIDGVVESYDRSILDITNKPPWLRAGDEVAVPKRIF